MKSGAENAKRVLVRIESHVLASILARYVSILDLLNSAKRFKPNIVKVLLIDLERNFTYSNIYKGYVKLGISCVI
jgi:hypothetical protein